MGNTVKKELPIVKENITFDSFSNLVSLKDVPDSYFSYGKTIRVINNLDYVKYVQDSCGGWVSEMIECINQLCVVLRVDHDKMVVLKSPSRKTWLFNRAALEPVNEDKAISSAMISSLMESSAFNGLKSLGNHVRRLSETIIKPSATQDEDSLNGNPNEDSHNEKSDEEAQSEYRSNMEERRAQLFSTILDGSVDKLYEIVDTDILNIPNSNGMTPINEACCHGKLEMVEVLITFGAIINYAPDRKGNFPIHNCAIHGEIEILKYLIEKHPENLTKKTMNHQSLVDIAKNLQNKELEDYLLSKDVPNYVDIQPNSPNSTSLSVEEDIQPYSPNSTSPPIEVDIQQNRPNSTSPPVEVDIQQNSPNSISTSVENECIICRDRKNKVTFFCGHLACEICANQLVICHICKAEIKGRITLYY